MYSWPLYVYEHIDKQKILAAINLFLVNKALL